VRPFELVRYRDPSGVSGTGVVAEGCVFTDGSVALRWRGNNPATAVWPDLESVLAVHGHHGATEVRWMKPVPVTPRSQVDHQSGDHRAVRPPTAIAPVPVTPRSEVDHVFGDHRAVRPATAIAEPAPAPNGASGWAGARHLR
jgi:hypothetical protein